MELRGQKDQTVHMPLASCLCFTDTFSFSKCLFVLANMEVSFVIFKNKVLCLLLSISKQICTFFPRLLSNTNHSQMNIVVLLFVCLKVSPHCGLGPSLGKKLPTLKVKHVFTYMTTFNAHINPS